MMKMYASKFPTARLFKYNDLFYEKVLEVPDEETGDEIVMGIKEDAWNDLLTLFKGSSSPGVPLMYTYPTNADVKNDSSVFKHLVEDRIHRLLDMQMEYYDENDVEHERDISFLDSLQVDPMEAVLLVQNGQSDPCRVLTKNEPHKIGKRTRIITSASAVDAMIDLILFYPQMRAEIMKVIAGTDNDEGWKQPSSIGIDLNTNKGKEAIYTTGLNKFCGKDAVDDDVQAYDVSYNVYCHKMYDEFWTCKGKECNQEEWWWDLKRARMWVKVHQLFMLSDGTLLATDRARLCSGERTTSHGGSCVRGYLPTFTAMSPVILESMVNGDDCVEQTGWESFDQVKDRYARFGFVMTDINRFEPSKREFHFCSHKFTPKGHIPETYGKALFNLLNAPRDWLQLNDFYNRYVVAGLLSGEELKPFLTNCTREAIEAGFRVNENSQ